MKGGFTGLEVLRRTSAAMASCRIFAPQVAVLAWVAEYPGASSYSVAAGVGVSQQHAYRIMKDLTTIGELWAVKVRRNRALTAHYVSPQGTKTLERLVNLMGLDVKGRYKIIQEREGEGFEI